MYTHSRRNRNVVNVWPGFVDALASVLLVFIFMLLIFVVGQFFLTDILIGRNQELYQLNQEVDVLSGDLIMEKHRTSTQKKQISALDASLKAANQELNLKLREIASLQEDISALRSFRKELENRVADMALVLEKQEKDLKKAAEKSEQDALIISARDQSIAELEELRDKLRSEIAELTTSIKLNNEELMAVRDRSKKLALKLSDEEERTRLAQEDIDKKDIRLQELRELLAQVDEALAQEKELVARTKEELEKTSAQLAKRESELTDKDKQLLLRIRELAERDEKLAERWEQIAQANAASALQKEEIHALRAELDLSSVRVGKQQKELDRLNAELNKELASKVRELSRYRSEFFGRLRDVLGEHPDISVVGDRFLFQSELLFESGSAELGDAGRLQLVKLAATLKTVASKIPNDINWILRVDGHTDRNPISTDEFPSNWELSTARALSIVNFLIAEGITPGKLAATGFGEFHPIDRGNSPQAFSRNRRIELKLTER